ncbi:hemolysin family protein [Halorussus limi]|uniref:Hemolysin family protein n=1 Tax=Halorussus limi TaxID=2938695 RepID=A0A8U0HZ63_9EURY|nr:hemolysin family protein [Halorussus limi]UPV76217.1 hemolysin family protein [Halorussus limi]
MGTAQIGLRLIAGLLLILANGFFVAIEFALTRARQFTEAEFVDGDSQLERAWEMTQNLELYLTTCQVGITASSIAVGIVAEPALAALFEPLFAGTTLATIGAGAIIAYGIINLIHLTHGEQTPTYLGVERSRMVCRYGATPLYWFYKIISPVITLGDWVAKWTLRLFGIEMTGAWLETEEEAIESRAQLHSRLNSVLKRGELSQERHEEVLNALAAGDKAVESVMVDSEEMVALSTEDSTEENLHRMSSSPHTRYPLFGSDDEDFLGIVYVPAVLDRIDELRAEEARLEDVAAPPMTVSADTTVSDAIDQFQAESQELALVLSEGDVVGLLTATDALEVVMGEIEDPLDNGQSRPGAVPS